MKLCLEQQHAICTIRLVIMEYAQFNLNVRVLNNYLVVVVVVVVVVVAAAAAVVTVYLQTMDNST